MIRGYHSLRGKSVFNNKTKVANEWQVVHMLTEPSLCYDLGLLGVLAESLLDPVVSQTSAVMAMLTS